MYKILTIVGARPQIIKSAAISRCIKNKYKDVFVEQVLHTGQHYDKNMSDVFFEELNIDKPDFNLNVGSGSHAYQTGEMMKGIEKVVVDNHYDAMIVYGDTNSTLAGALVGVKAQIPVVHIEAGLRSYDKRMPEELNRIATDHISSLLFSPTETGLLNLQNEGLREGVRQPDFPNHKDRLAFHCGDIMYDNSLYYSGESEMKKRTWFDALRLNDNYILATVHRAENTDDKAALSEIMNSIIELSERNMVVIPMHPRTSSALNNSLDSDTLDKIYHSDSIKIIPPASFLEMIMLEKNSKLVVTDSGGVQKEAFYFKRPSIVLREETEWIENVKAGASILAGHDIHRILKAYDFFENNSPVYPDLYGDGHAADFIMERLQQWLDN